MSCNIRTAFIERVRRNKNQIFENSLNDIRTMLYPEAVYGIDCREERIDEFGSPRNFRNGEDRYVILDPYVYVANKGISSRGCYDFNTGRIFLKGGFWCISTIIHETLHSVSIFTRNLEIANRYIFLNEGLTDLLTGYILFKKYDVCFNSWKNNANELCKRADDYYNYSRLWYTFFRFVDFNEIISLYFGINEIPWTNIWTDLLSKIGSEDVIFRNPFSDARMSSRDILMSECRRHFGREFDLIYELESFNFEYEKCAKSVTEEETYNEALDNGWILSKEIGDIKIIRYPFTNIY